MVAKQFAIGFAFAALLLVASVLSARADVVESAATGFAIVEKAQISAAPEKLYDALIHPENWWNAEHSFSNDAHNLSLDARAGGCLCETLPNGGSVQHLTVIFAAPGKTLRLKGAMGPFQGQGLEGVLTFNLKPEGSGTALELDYNIGGFMKGGFGKMPQAADAMLTDLVAHLKYYAETGKAMPGASEGK
jgi:uncharacterized protein YndB with AHSA1/START domain